MEWFDSYLPLIISAISLGFSAFTFFIPSTKDRRQGTLDAFNRLQKQALEPLHRCEPAEMQEIARHPRSDKYREVSEYIALIEHFAVGTNRRIYAKAVVYELAHGFLDGAIRNRIEPIISVKNRSGHDYYAHLHKLYKWMDKKTKRKDKWESLKSKWPGRSNNSGR